ncbi:hypothetical protein [Psychromonas antarctica]|uniref:hypothetical protein n=1 Tax=Psychromonas antarctica TaxID=67573 RepID=UPI001EE8F498|nr:hypothetical protein [Psychromonas antarctica]MCG6202911.1 hypothetical protein [Psychromonas antarctica]
MKIRRTTAEQFKIDFQSFPPIGLSLNAFYDREFEVNNSFLKKVFNIPKTFYNILCLVFVKLFTDGIFLDEMHRVGILKVKSDIAELKAKIQKTYQIKTSYLVLLLLMSVPIWLLFTPVFLLILFFKSSGSIFPNIVASIKLNTDKQNAKGHASRILGNVVHIANTDDLERTISHEHIHIVQFDFIESIDHSRFSSPDSKLFNFDPVKDEYSYYLINRFELEVRVHEVVRTIYMKNNRLPLTLSEFEGEVIAFLDAAECRINGITNHSALGSDLEHLTSRLTIYLSKSLMDEGMDSITDLNESQMDKVLDFRKKLISELYSVCYGNLLEYYGDLQASKQFKSQIYGPNLYNFIYKSAH